MLRINHITEEGPELDIVRQLFRDYEKAGFRNISAYYHNPLPGVVYMEKTL